MPNVIGQNGLVDDSLKVPQPSDPAWHLARTLGIMMGDVYGLESPQSIAQREKQTDPLAPLTTPTHIEAPAAGSTTEMVPAGGDTGLPPVGGGAATPARTNTSSFQSRLLTQAQQYLGIPYVYGGTNPKTGLDCSGFVQRVFADMNIPLPRVTYDQVKVGQALTNRQQLQPGDLVFFVGDGNRTNGHVGIFMGGDLMIDAPHTGANVGIRRIPWDRLTAMRRVMGPQPTGPQVVRV